MVTLFVNQAYLLMYQFSEYVAGSAVKGLFAFPPPPPQKKNTKNKTKISWLYSLLPKMQFW